MFDKGSSLIHDLPDELLTEIRRWNAERNIGRRLHCALCDSLDDRRDRSPLQDTINASKVSQRWRDVLTCAPELWRHFIDLHHPTSEWTQILLERSKGLGITYSIASTDSVGGIDELVREVANADRLLSYSVNLHMDYKVWYDERIPARWPKLGFLCITHFVPVVPEPEDDDSESEESEEEGEFLPDEFPSRTSTPHLEHLHLDMAGIRDISQLAGLSGLRELHVNGGGEWSMAQWFEVISQLPRLKYLALCAVLEPFPGSEWPANRTLPLDF